MLYKILNRIIALFLVLASSMFAYADDSIEEIKIVPKVFKSSRPHIPAYIPITCIIDGMTLTVSSSKATVVNADVYVTSTSENVASYFSSSPAETHVFYVEPQNDYLTIDIEVDGRMFTGEFYH